MNIKKIISIFIIIIFLCQSVAFCVSDRNSTLRLPLYFNKPVERKGASRKLSPGGLLGRGIRAIIYELTAFDKYIKGQNGFVDFFRRRKKKKKEQVIKEVKGQDEKEFILEELRGSKDIVGSMLKNILALYGDAELPTELKATVEEFERIYRKLAGAASMIIVRYYELSRMYDRDPGEIRLYMVGGRLEGRPLKVSSDIDLIFCVENPQQSIQSFSDRFKDPMDAIQVANDAQKWMRNFVSQICEELDIPDSRFHIISYGSPMPLRRASDGSYYNFGFPRLLLAIYGATDSNRDITPLSTGSAGDSGHNKDSDTIVFELTPNLTEAITSQKNTHEATERGI